MRSSLKSEWNNSGYGLFFLYNLFGSLGHFFIASGSKALLFESRNGAREMDCDIEGVLISLRISLSDEARIEAALQIIRDRAFKVKEQLGTRNVDIASVTAFLNESNSTI